jgi:hypothetical protein
LMSVIYKSDLCTTEKTRSSAGEVILKPIHCIKLFSV